jgi:hypothetical protein
MSQVLQGIPGTLQLRDPLVQRLDAAFSQFARSRAILAGVETEQLSDLLQCETSRLGLADEKQTPQVPMTIVTKSAIARWGLQKAFALVKADRLHADIARRSELPDRQ